MRVTLLGCGGSDGVPAIGCECSVCLSANPKNRRLRVSAYIETGDTCILIDSSPDLRQQALANDIGRVDAVLYTHAHSDHVAGIDDLRAFNKLSESVLPVYGDWATLDTLQRRVPYAFLPRPEFWFRTCLEAHVLPDSDVQQFMVGNLPVTAFKQGHGKAHSMGYRIGNFAYCVDTDVLSETAFAALEGVEVWIVDCLRYTKSHSHSHLDNTLQWIARVKPRQAILTHMAHELEYETLAAELPPGVVPGYDGLKVEL